MKEAIKKEISAEKLCEHCGMRRPYHLLSCPKVVGRVCPVCQAVYPRHYPRCEMDVLGIWRWWIGMHDQKMLLEMVQIERRAAMAEGRAVLAEASAEERWEVGADQPMRPANGQKMVRRIFEMMKSKSVKEMREKCAEIHREVEELSR